MVAVRSDGDDNHGPGLDFELMRCCLLARRPSEELALECQTGRPELVSAAGEGEDEDEGGGSFDEGLELREVVADAVVGVTADGVVDGDDAAVP